MFGFPSERITYAQFTHIFTLETVINHINSISYATARLRSNHSP
jgi:hypothetical protein